MQAVPLTGNERRDAVRQFKADVARDRIRYLESLPKPTKAQREQLDRERATLACNS